VQSGGLRKVHIYIYILEKVHILRLSEGIYMWTYIHQRIYIYMGVRMGVQSGGLRKVHIYMYA